MKANSDNYYLYNPKLANRAKKLRNSMTKAECIIWREVLSGRKTGFQFRRQRPIGNYIADFVCLPLRLVIEVDWASHELEGANLHDKTREQFLTSVGFQVIRIHDEDVLIEHLGISRYIVEKVSRRAEEIQRLKGD